MTIPTSGDDKERKQALTNAQAALVKARRIKDRGSAISEGWRRSREENHFHQLLKAIRT